MTLFEMPRPEAGTDNRDQVERWLDEVGLADSPDPDVTMIRDATAELDWLTASDLADKDLVAARKSVRYTITTARKNLQRLIDRNDSSSTRRRHQVLYAGVVGESLGWIDLDLLSGDLRQDVLNHLEAEHGITIRDLEGTVKEL